MDRGVSLEALLAGGLRGVLYQEVFSPRPEEVDERLADLEAKLAKLEERIGTETSRPNGRAGDRSARIVLGVSPHAPFSVSGPLFRKVRQWATSKGLPVCIHVAESEEESLLIEEGRGPMAESLLSRGIQWSAPGCSPVQYLDRLGVLAPGTLLVHCVRLRPPDLPILQRSGVSVAHCPKSNWKLGHGWMNLKQVFEAGIPLGLGSDSVASNNNMDLFEEMRFGLFNPSWFSRTQNSLAEGDTRGGFRAEQALHLATLGGAEALGISGSIGSLESGKQADLIAVDLTGIHTIPVFSPVTAIAHSARASDVILTMVEGEVLFEKGTVTTLDEAELKKQVGRIMEKMKSAVPV
jgi:5-methylthioadenosine/S-adenosylhomocysteine deaminase